MAQLRCHHWHNQGVTAGTTMMSPRMLILSLRRRGTLRIPPLGLGPQSPPRGCLEGSTSSALGAETCLKEPQNLMFLPQFWPAVNRSCCWGWLLTPTSKSPQQCSNYVLMSALITCSHADAALPWGCPANLGQTSPKSRAW